MDQAPTELNSQGRQLLALLVARLPSVKPEDPRTFVGYKALHDAMHLSRMGPTWGESLKEQGLSNLAEWTATTGKPGVTGLIIDTAPTKLVPANGYFKLFKRRPDDYPWWINEVRLSKLFDWTPYIAPAPQPDPPESPTAVDIEAPPDRQQFTTYRIIRDTLLARRVKEMHNYQCQLCDHIITLADGHRYAEAHHIRPLGRPHDGPDRIENIMCLCPNHHAEMDLGIHKVSTSDLRSAPGHVIDEQYISYHNETVYDKP